MALPAKYAVHKEVKTKSALVSEGIHTLFGYTMVDHASAEVTVKLLDGEKGNVVAVERFPAKGSAKLFSTEGVELENGSLWIEVTGEVDIVVYYL